LEAGTISVQGTGNTLYYVHDNTGQKLGFAYTNKSLEFFPGDYRASLHGVVIPVKVEAGRDTPVAAGRVVAPGSESTLYYVYDPKGEKQLAYAYTNTDIELLPGSYGLELNRTRRSFQVSAGRRTVVDR
jgi:hypothetical protein